jgi:hypothetical protein
MAIALADVGKSVREILYGTPKEGTFTYDQKVTYSTKTADGVVRLALSAAASPACVPAGGIVSCDLSRCGLSCIALPPMYANVW